MLFAGVASRDITKRDAKMPAFNSLASFEAAAAAEITARANTSAFINWLGSNDRVDLLRVKNFITAALGR